MIMRYKKAISPLIATIILIAVTIAIAVIVVAWIYGIFGSATGPTEKLQIFQDARLVNKTSGNNIIVTFNVTVKNIGTSVVTIQKVYIKENATCTGSNPTLTKGDTTVQSLNPGDVATLSVTFQNCQVVPGITYTVIIVTGGGQSYSVPTTAEQG